MSKRDTWIGHAPSAFWKTMAVIEMIAKRRINTHILVHSHQLLDQWQETPRWFLPNINIGVIGGGKKRPTGIIDAATYQSLMNKKNNTISSNVQDCIDCGLPLLHRMFNNREKSYLTMGYIILFSGESASTDEVK